MLLEIQRVNAGIIRVICIAVYRVGSENCTLTMHCMMSLAYLSGGVVPP
jgi:hypothetical protein